MEGVIPSNWAGDGDHGVTAGGPNEQILNAATHGQTVDSGINPSLTQFYAEIEARASREATPEIPAEGNTSQQETIHEELARTENGYTAGAGPGQIQTASMDIVQNVVEIEQQGQGSGSEARIALDELSPAEAAAENEMEVDVTTAAGHSGRAFPAKSVLANLAMYNDSQAARATSSPLSEAPEAIDYPAGSRGKASVRSTEVANAEVQRIEEEYEEGGVAQQEMIDALRAAAQGRLPLGGVTLQEENRPADVPRGLRYSEEEVRRGIHIQPIVELLSNLTDPSLIKEAHLMLERGKTPSTFFRVDTRINEHYERDLTEFKKESELKAAQIRKDRDLAAQMGGTAVDETIQTMASSVNAESGPSSVPSGTLNPSVLSTFVDGSSDDRIPGVPQKKPQPSPVNRELRVDMYTLHPAQLYNLEMFRRKTLKEPPLEVTLLKYISTKSLRKRTPEPEPEPAPIVPPAPRKTKAERDAEKAEEQLERERLAAEIVKAMAEEERTEPLPDNSDDDAYDPVDGRRSRRMLARGKPGSEEEDAEYERLPSQSGRRRGPRSGRVSRRQTGVIVLDADEASSAQGQAVVTPKRGRGRPRIHPLVAVPTAPLPLPTATPGSSGAAVPASAVRPTPKRRGRPPLERPTPDAIESFTARRTISSRSGRAVSEDPSQGTSAYVLEDDMMNDVGGFEDNYESSSPPAQRPARSSRRGPASPSVEPLRPSTRKRRQSSDAISDVNERANKRGRKGRADDEGIESASNADQRRVTRSRREESPPSKVATRRTATHTGAISNRGRGRGRPPGWSNGRSARGRGLARTVTRGHSNRKVTESPEVEATPGRSTRSGIKIMDSNVGNATPTRSTRANPALASSSRRGRPERESVATTSLLASSPPRTTRSSGRPKYDLDDQAPKRTREAVRPGPRRIVSQTPLARRTTRGSGPKLPSPAPRTPRERNPMKSTAASRSEPSSRATRARGSPVSTNRSLRAREASGPESPPGRSSARVKVPPKNPKASPVQSKRAATKSIPAKPTPSRPMPAKSKAIERKTSAAIARSSRMEKHFPRPVKGPTESTLQYFDGRNLVKGRFALEVVIESLPKSTKRLFKRQLLPPIPDGAMPRRPYDGLQEGGSARRQMAASSEVDPMEDVDAALLNAASQQVIESDDNAPLLRRKGKERATSPRNEDDEITVDFESEDGYEVRNIAAEESSDDDDEAEIEDDPDFAQRFAFLK